MAIKVIDKVTTFNPINKKAEEVSNFCKGYEGCLLAKEDNYREFRKLIKMTVALSNQRYPRTKPFEIYNDGNNSNYIYICVQGNSEQSIVRIFFTTVTGVFHKSLNEPLESISYALKGKEVSYEGERIP